MLQGLIHLVLSRSQASEQVHPVRHDKFGCLGRSRSSEVCRKIAQGVIRLMSDGRDDGRHCRRDGPHHPFVVKSPQFFDTAAAPSDDHHIHTTRSIQQLDPPNDLLRCFVPLDLRRKKQNRNSRMAASRHRHNIPDRCACRRGHHAYRPGQ